MNTLFFPAIQRPSLTKTRFTAKSADKTVPASTLSLNKLLNLNALKNPPAFETYLPKGYWGILEIPLQEPVYTLPQKLLDEQITIQDIQIQRGQNDLREPTINRLIANFSLKENDYHYRLDFKAFDNFPAIRVHQYNEQDQLLGITDLDIVLSDSPRTPFLRIVHQSEATETRDDKAPIEALLYLTQLLSRHKQAVLL